MQVYSELTAPTAVSFATTIPFLSADRKNLIVGKGSLLQIYETKVVSAEEDTTDQRAASTSNQKLAGASTAAYHTRRDGDDNVESALLAGDGMLLQMNKSNNTKLVLVAEYPIAGTICGLAGIKMADTKSGGDLLVVALRVAKATVLEWDPETHTMHDCSIHYWENELGAPFDLPLYEYPTNMESDPGSRCAAVRFGMRSLSILPFKQASVGMMDGDDWDVELDGPRPKDDARDAAMANGTSNDDEEQAKYSKPSFHLRFPQIEPELLFVQHFAFLHEYREPTFGVLSSSQEPVSWLGRQDIMTYKVFTIDLQQQASTAILSVERLPEDLSVVIPLPPPIGGALLMGDDELIHVAQSGKAVGVATNHFGAQRAFPMADQSYLGIGLEHCTVAQLSIETGELLLAHTTGQLYIIRFKMDGRTVSGISLEQVPEDRGGTIIPSQISCLTKLDKHTFFVGSSTGDSFVMGWSRKNTQAGKKKARVLEESFEYDLDDLDLEDDDDDDLYGESAMTSQGNSASDAAKDGDIVFRIHDTMMSIAPIREMTSGTKAFFPDSEESKNSADVIPPLQICAAVGRGKSGALAVLNRQVLPKVTSRFAFPEARDMWAMTAQKPVPKALQGEKGVAAVMGNAGNDYMAGQFDNLMIVAKVDLDGYETSDAYVLTPSGFEHLTGTEFDPAAGFTLEAGTMGKHSRVIQVLKSEVRVYDGDLKLQQIVPMLDDETGAEPRVVGAGIVDPYLLIIRDDSSVWMAQIDSNGEVEEMERSDEKLSSTKWLSGCLYADPANHFNQGLSPENPGVLAFLVSATGILYIYALPNLSKPIYVAEGLGFIPPLLTTGFASRKGTAKETLTEILVADLGDATHTSPYLILRNSTDDLTIYEPVMRPAKDDFKQALAFRKVHNEVLALRPEAAAQDDASQQPRFVPLRACSNIGGYSTVFLPGSSPSFVIKTSKSTPKVIGLCGVGVRGLSSFHTEGCDHGFIYADSNGVARVSQFHANHNFDLGVSVQKIPMPMNIQQVTFHQPTGTYVVGGSMLETFELPKDDEHHKEWAKEKAGTLQPKVPRGHVLLLNPITWTVIQDIELEPCEDILCMKSLELEVSEMTKQRKMLVVVGTGINKGQDLPIRGRIHVYDVAIVIPEAGRPETNKRLKQIAKEEIPRGAVTAVSEIGTQGLMLVAQGQKCMVRGLKEDGSLLPVAFMDMSIHVVAAKELRTTGLCVMADSVKGVWFTGCTEEPYKMQLFGKSRPKLQCVTADFLPDGKLLFIVVSDTKGDLHMLQFDPEHPRSLQGHNLLHQTTFCMESNGPQVMTLLPRYKPAVPGNVAFSTIGTVSSTSAGKGREKETAPVNPFEFSILMMASESGILSTLTPLSESAYQRLLSLSSQLTASLPVQAGTNPKAYRTPDADLPKPGVDTAAGRVIVDGCILRRWNELGSGRRAELAGKGGYDSVHHVRAELDSLLGWRGITYY